jgi:hypothetical protein
MMPLPSRLSGSTDSNQLKPKEVLSNRYTVERTLGSGTCGTALLVSDRKDKDENERKQVFSFISSTNIVIFIIANLCNAVCICCGDIL